MGHPSRLLRQALQHTTLNRLNSRAFHTTLSREARGGSQAGGSGKGTAGGAEDGTGGGAGNSGGRGSGRGGRGQAGAAGAGGEDEEEPAGVTRSGSSYRSYLARNAEAYQPSPPPPSSSPRPTSSHQATPSPGRRALGPVIDTPHNAHRDRQEVDYEESPQRPLGCTPTTSEAGSPQHNGSPANAAGPSRPRGAANDPAFRAALDRHHGPNIRHDSEDEADEADAEADAVRDRGEGEEGNEEVEDGENEEMVDGGDEDEEMVDGGDEDEEMVDGGGGLTFMVEVPQDLLEEVVAVLQGGKGKKAKKGKMAKIHMYVKERRRGPDDDREGGGSGGKGKGRMKGGLGAKGKKKAVK